MRPWNTVVCGRIAAISASLSLVKERCTTAVEVGVAAAHKDAAADAALDRGFDALGAEGLGVHIEAGIVLVVGAEGADELLLLRQAENDLEYLTELRAYRLDLPAELIVK